MSTFTWINDLLIVLIEFVHMKEPRHNSEKKFDVVLVINQSVKIILHIQIRPGSQNLRIVNCMLYIVKIGPFGNSNVNWYANKRRIQAKIYSIGNLVMHFHKIAYIPWFHYTELWEWLGAGPHILRRGCFFLWPWTKLYRFSTKNHHEKLHKWHFQFLSKSFLKNLSSRLAHRLNFHFINF